MVSNTFKDDSRPIFLRSSAHRTICAWKPRKGPRWKSVSHVQTAANQEIDHAVVRQKRHPTRWGLRTKKQSNDSTLFRAVGAPSATNSVIAFAHKLSLGKTSYTWHSTVVRGIMCNWLVCMGERPNRCFCALIAFSRRTGSFLGTFCL